MINGNILITGGAGTLGKAILERADREGWNANITVFSRDPMKHVPLKKLYPHVNFVLGDINDERAVDIAVAGKDTVIHAAAMKHIPQAEDDPGTTYYVNVDGSINVALACVRHGVKHLVAISTDKACYPVNTYGCSKLMMERYYQQLALVSEHTNIHLTRYGNVLGSTGSVIQVWRDMYETNSRKVFATDPDMTRFWITVEDAVDQVVAALGEPSGTILIPNPNGLSMKLMAKYVLPGNAEIEYTGLRPGEKKHEIIMTREESLFARQLQRDGELETAHRLYPVTGEPFHDVSIQLSSIIADEITREQLLRMIGEL